jgi:hypothetical protein
MNKKSNKIICRVDDDLFKKVEEMRKSKFLNISALIREFLEKTYERVKNGK